MAARETDILSDEQLADYEELGFIHSIPILSDDEVRRYRAEIDRTCQALGGRVTRLDAAHLYFRWAWELTMHPRLVACIEQLLGSDILLQSTRLFYKHGMSDSFVGWHQDGITQRITDARVPAIWLGLTAATVENGCLRVVPRSHRYGLIPHANRPNAVNLTTQGLTAQIEIDSPRDLVMRPGEMSVHHPLVLHASNPNRSEGPRIGFTATYATSARAIPNSEPPTASLDEAIAAYRARHHQIFFADEQPVYGA
jgi:ectoine hydroxylase-related dioxygenase (phytanoyl-CoA dioxygenase family)